MSLQDNKALARRGIEACASGNTEAVDEIYAADYVNYQHHHPSSPEVIRGAAAWKAFVAEFHQAFPDFHDTIEDQIAEADKVVTRFTSQGTHRGTFMNIAPTGKQVSWMSVSIDRIRDGRIVESWSTWDMMGMLEQLGAVSMPK